MEIDHDHDAVELARATGPRDRVVKFRFRPKKVQDELETKN